MAAPPQPSPFSKPPTTKVVAPRPWTLQKYGASKQPTYRLSANSPKQHRHTYTNEDANQQAIWVLEINPRTLDSGFTHVQAQISQTDGASTRADVGWSYVISDGHLNATQSDYIVATANGDLYKIFILEQNTDIYWTKSTDNGLTWNEPTLIDAATVAQLAVWYDQWSTATGSLIYIVWGEAALIHFRTLDTSDDSMGTDTTAFTGVSGAGTTLTLSITKAVGGNLMIAYDIDGGTEVGCVKSTDAGANWAAAATVFEAVNDYVILLPDFQADTQDIMALFWDKTADAITLKRFDDDGDAWAEEAIFSTMVESGSSSYGQQWSAAVDRANSRVFVIAWSAQDTLNADLRFATITASAITEGTNVVLNSGANQAACGLALSTDRETLYAFYGGKSDGSENPGTSMNVYYKTSTDQGTTWGSETLLTQYARDWTHMYVTPTFTGTDFVVMFGGVNVLGPASAPAFFVNVPLTTPDNAQLGCVLYILTEPIYYGHPQPSAL